ncbi:hypothetical protein EEO36_22365 [Salmonella enterica]|nr:hypothetical protein [Salmonella enterica]
MSSAHQGLLDIQGMTYTAAGRKARESSSASRSGNQASSNCSRFGVRQCYLILKPLQIKIIRLSVMADGNADKLHPVMCSGGRIFSL